MKEENQESVCLSCITKSIPTFTFIKNQNTELFDYKTEQLRRRYETMRFLKRANARKIKIEVFERDKDDNNKWNNVSVRYGYLFTYIEGLKARYNTSVSFAIVVEKDYGENREAGIFNELWQSYSSKDKDFDVEDNSLIHYDLYGSIKTRFTVVED